MWWRECVPFKATGSQMAIKCKNTNTYFEILACPPGGFFHLYIKSSNCWAGPVGKIHKFSLLSLVSEEIIQRAAFQKGRHLFCVTCPCPGPLNAQAKRRMLLITCPDTISKLATWRAFCRKIQLEHRYPRLLQYVHIWTRALAVECRAVSWCTSIDLVINDYWLLATPSRL